MPHTPDVDVVVVGAGFAGLYSTHRLRNLLGLTVQSFDAGSGPGGTWYWNRYPGARCDIESVWYSYSFDEDLQREWRWSERFAGQAEILRYLEHVADRFDLRRSYRWNTRVTSAVWNDDEHHWTVSTDDGATTTARFVVSCAGNLNVPKENEFPGQETFAGEVHRTSAWPHEGVDLTGKRVGVIGTGATGIQLIPRVAEQAAHLTVFQRTPNFACPLGNRAVDDEEFEEITSNYPELRRRSRANFGGAPYPDPMPSALAVSDEVRDAEYAKYYDGGGFRMLLSAFADVILDKRANDTASDYIRDRIRERVEDPRTAELLCPTDHPYGTKRAPFETGYYEAFNRDDVDLVDVGSAPITAITPTGVRTAVGEYELDVIVLATGFDAFTGSLLKMGYVGRGGTSLNEKWEHGPSTYLGIAVPGFPNLFTITGPQSPVALYNNPLAIEDHVEFASRAIEHTRSRGATVFEATEDAAAEWGRMTVGVGDLTLLPLAPSSFYTGSNVPGKPRVMLFFAGGAPLYRAMCDQVEGTGYGGFAVDGAAAPIPPMVLLDPAAAMVTGIMIGQEQRPFEQLTLEEQRGAFESFTFLQRPPRASVTTTEVTYPGAAGPRTALVHVPDEQGPLPVVVFYHPGGWVGGSVGVSAEPCSVIAEELGAVVIAPSYRLAPEDPQPAAGDDAYAALAWAAEVAPEYGGDPTQLFVVGESAGGTLAACLGARVRDEGGPAIAAQVLIYPAIDPDADTPSRRLYAAGPPITVAAMDQMWQTYLGANRVGTRPAGAIPGAIESVAGLPETLLVTVELDPLRDEGEEFAHRLAAAGVPVETVRVERLIHGVLNMSGVVPRAHEITDAVVDYLRRRVAQGDRVLVRG
ncbi:flavin-containing monooxygenase [Pseudonocardia abyssalis]|uniref:Alpha/beta hydrolase fold domain-containing protein n=1 Tax=Pseudonocardia abyssalis TaxID=2792008 RepID=A0ABS6USY1_9PSEU|nr:alpha/beta hydrolase fold domain-containing protein [Pseudonocardia abyssalis]MBW0114287.1 alpha/beta hydrolase fold domain-containing protein [Pseudonocardia abyssalis]MBW0134849.1 alpha/beta hydrolase fold domain-containing protein [Pseudonocardia abyssalis]